MMRGVQALDMENEYRFPENGFALQLINKNNGRDTKFHFEDIINWLLIYGLFILILGEFPEMHVYGSPDNIQVMLNESQIGMIIFEHDSNNNDESSMLTMIPPEIIGKLISIL